jgi:hypothetical protein
MIKYLLIAVTYSLAIFSCGERGAKSKNDSNISYQVASTNVLSDSLHTLSIDSNGVIIPAGNMLSPRADHTATLLNDGTVLICGGFTGNSSVATCEIYNPTSQKFTQINNLLIARSGHSATLLPNGKVFICGGYNGNYLSTTEIYDPLSRSFSPGPGMTTARSEHTATQLDNGKILFVGGVGDGWTFLSSAEIYDVKANKFIPVGSMVNARESHTATLLKNGNVLIAGGHRDRRENVKIYASAEIFDSKTSKFSTTENMKIPRHKHDAVLLFDGKVMINGGSDQRDSRGVYSSAEIYDPDKSQFTFLTNMNFPRYKHKGTTVLLKDKNVLVCGGSDKAEIYNFTNGKFYQLQVSMTSKRLFSCATLLDNGEVLITGGYDEDNRTSSGAWLYTNGNR